MCGRQAFISFHMLWLDLLWGNYTDINRVFSEEEAALHPQYQPCNHVVASYTHSLDITVLTVFRKFKRWNVFKGWVVVKDVFVMCMFSECWLIYMYERFIRYQKCGLFKLIHLVAQYSWQNWRQQICNFCKHHSCSSVKLLLKERPTSKEVLSALNLLHRWAKFPQ